MTDDDRIREVIGVAEELQRAERERAAAEVDVREVGAELGIEPRFVAQAEEKLAARSITKLRVAVVSTMLAVAVTGGVVAALRAPRAPASPAASANAPGPRPWSQPSLAGRVVIVDRFTSDGAACGDGPLVAAGARAESRERALDDASLAGAHALVLIHPRRRAFDEVEVGAIERFVRRGGGLVIADLGWSWVSSAKKPLEALPANVLGARLDFGFEPTVTRGLGRVEIEGAPPIARTTGWVAGALRLRGPEPRVLVRDLDGAPVVGVVRSGLGRVVVLGHHGLVDDNPWLLAWSVAASLGEAR